MSLLRQVLATVVLVAALAAAPSRVSATFNEQLQSAFAAMTVVGPDGNLWSDGAPQVQGAMVSIGACWRCGVVDEQGRTPDPRLA